MGADQIVSFSVEPERRESRDAVLKPGPQLSLLCALLDHHGVAEDPVICVDIEVDTFAHPLPQAHTVALHGIR